MTKNWPYSIFSNTIVHKLQSRNKFDFHQNFFDWIDNSIYIKKVTKINKTQKIFNNNNNNDNKTKLDTEN